MAGEISEYQVVEFVNLKAASAAAAALMEFVKSPRGMRHLTGPRRAVIWGEGPEALMQHQSRLYLSAGAMEAAGELKLTMTPRDKIAAAALPATTLLLFGEGIARPSA